METITEQAQEKCSQLAEKLKDQRWHALDTKGFEKACSFAITQLSAVQKQLVQLHEHSAFQTLESEKELSQKANELQTVIAKLEKNLAMEQKKSPHKIADLNLLPDSEPYNEQFAALQHQAATGLISASQTLEKIRLELQKESVHPSHEKNTSQALLELLKKRESELQELKKNYSQARIDSLIGQNAKETPAEMEHDFQQTSQKISQHHQRLSERLKHHNQHVENMYQSSGQLRQETLAFQELLWQQFQKAQTLITQLKKERDTARQLVLDTELETLKLRSTYTQELLQAQEKTVNAREKAKAEFDLRLEKMQNELEHKNQLISHFKDTVAHQSSQIHSLEEKNQKFQLFFKTKQKHENAKKVLSDSKQPEPTETEKHKE